MTLDTYIIPIWIGRTIKGCLRVPSLPNRDVRRIAYEHARVNLARLGEFLHFLHLAFGEANVVDGDALGRHANEVGKVPFKDGEGVGDDVDIVDDGWRMVWVGEGALVVFSFDGLFKALCASERTAGEALWGVDDDVGEGSINGCLNAKVAKGDAFWDVGGDKEGTTVIGDHEKV